MWFLGASVLFMILFMVMMFAMMSRGACRGPRMSEWWRGNRADAERILAERLSREEIGAEEYVRVRAALRRSRAGARRT